MPVQVGLPAPPFKAQAYLRQGDQFKTISLDDYKDSWLCLYFYVYDFSGLCPTEIAAFDKALADFRGRKCELVACSCDSHFAHKAWCDASAELGKLRHPMMSDMTKRIAMDYGVLVPDKGVSLRGTFLIDPKGVLRWSAVYDLPVGRGIGEILRVLDALQSGAACPCDWTKGEGTL